MKTPEERKTENLKVRITQAEKAMLEAYCEEHDIKMSEFIRTAVIQKLKNQEVR